MATGSYFDSDLFSLYKVVQNTQILYAKELLISQLKEYYSKDSKFHFVADEYGFPKVQDLTDVDPNGGINDDLYTRIYIGMADRYDQRFLPAMLVRHSGSTYKAISFNQERDCIQYDVRIYVDGYGNEYKTYTPKAFIFAGAWDSTFDIDILCESSYDRSIIAEASSMLFQNIALDDLTNAGLFVKNTRVSGETTEDFNNDKIFKQTITLDCRGEFRRLIPINDLVEIINLCAEFGTISVSDPNAVAENLTINFEITLDDMVVHIAETS